MMLSVLYLSDSLRETRRMIDTRVMKAKIVEAKPPGDLASTV